MAKITWHSRGKYNPSLVCIEMAGDGITDSGEYRLINQTIGNWFYKRN